MERFKEGLSEVAPEAKARPIYLMISASAGEGMDLPTLWKALIKKKWLIIAVTAVCATAAIVYSLIAPPVYRVEVVLTPVTQSRSSDTLSRIGGLASLVGINVGATGDSVQSVALLQSKKFIEDFIRDEHLLPILFANDWDAANRRWKSKEAKDQPDIRDAVKYFADNVRIVSQDSLTGLVTFAIEWKDPQQAADWATKLVFRINENIRQRDIEDSKKKLVYLSEQLRTATILEVRQAIAQVIQDQISTMTMAQVQTDYAFKVIDPATVPKTRIRPKRTLIVLVAVFLGGGLGVFIVLVRLMSNRSPTRPDVSAG